MAVLAAELEQIRLGRTSGPLSLSTVVPPELLCQIIEATITRTFDTSTYDERQRTLRNLSLVDRRFSQTAQLLLPQVVWIRSQKNLTDLLEHHRAELVQELFLQGMLGFRAVKRFFSRCRNLRSLIVLSPVNWASAINLSVCTSESALSSLFRRGERSLKQAVAFERSRSSPTSQHLFPSTYSYPPSFPTFSLHRLRVFRYGTSPLRSFDTTVPSSSRNLIRPICDQLGALPEHSNHGSPTSARSYRDHLPWVLETLLHSRARNSTRSRSSNHRRNRI